MKKNESGYRPCACRDCMETAIGKSGAMCWECEEAGCELDSECSVEPELVPDTEPAPAPAPYFTLVLSYVEPGPLRTKWHPTERFGPFATLVRGSFASEDLARGWAWQEGVDPSTYTIKPSAP